jgi:cadmium resistance transport/sequestration family protein
VILWLGLALFAVTNIDDIFVLLTFFADPTCSARHIVVGQFLGMSALIAISLLGALSATAIPVEYVGLLGFIPMALGVKKLTERGVPETSVDRAHASRFAAARPLVVAAVTVANGGDNVGAYLPLFSTRSRQEVVILVVTFLALTGVWCLAAYRLVNHPRVGKAVRRYGRVVLPLALLALGAYILWGCAPLRAFLHLTRWSS